MHSLLGIMTPLENLEDLKHDVHKQFKEGKLQATGPITASGVTPGFAKLIRVLEQKSNRNFGKYAVVDLDSSESSFDNEGEKVCVLCLKQNDVRPATWIDSFMPCPVDDNTLILSNHVKLYGGQKLGGVYLILWKSVDEPQKLIASTQDEMKNHFMDLLAGITTSIRIFSKTFEASATMLENRVKESQKQGKEMLDLMACFLELGNQDLVELLTDTTQEGRKPANDTAAQKPGADQDGGMQSINKQETG